MTELSLIFSAEDVNVSIRGMRTADGVDHWSVFDFINKACNRDSADAYGRKLFHKLIADESEHKDELLSLCKYQKFAGISFAKRSSPLGGLLLGR